MRAVNTVSLNGNAWQIEVAGCEAGDPDRQEILADSPRHSVTT
jgi:hypothetical protein